MKKFLKIFLAVVMIIGMLALVAGIFLAPQFKKLEQDAKDKMSQGMLLNIYTSAHASRAELGSFPPTLNELGFDLSPHMQHGAKVTYQGDKESFSASVEQDGITYEIDQDRRITRTPPLKK